MEEKNAIIKEVYQDNDIGFGSIAQTLRWARQKDPTITYKDIAQWIERNRHRKTNLPGFNSFVSKRPKEEYQMDLFFMNDFKELTQADMPVLLMVDAFTKITQMVPLRGKRDEDVMSGMEKCIEKMGGTPPDHLYGQGARRNVKPHKDILQPSQDQTACNRNPCRNSGETDKDHQEHDGEEVRTYGQDGLAGSGILRRSL